MRKTMIFILLLFSILIIGCSNQKIVEEAKSQKSQQQLENEQEKEKENEVNDIEDKSTKSMVKEKKDLPGAFIVSIDNHKNAYPQSGLDKADRVYEILAEGGITRYLAIFHSKSAEKIGPIRSARYYFAYIVKGHDFPFAHAGGNTDALALIPKLGIKDLDEIYNAGAYFWRDNKRKMPHNLYTSTDLLLKGAKAKGYKLIPLKTLPQGEIAGGKPVDLIDIIYCDDPRYLYTVTYEWDGEKYKRFINGTPHKTLDGNEIYTENVIILEAKTKEVVKEELQSEIDLIGSGKAVFFTKGKQYEGTWRKKNSGSEFEFIFNGKSMKFIGEHAWINVVPDLKNVSCKNLNLSN